MSGGASPAPAAHALLRKSLPHTPYPCEEFLAVTQLTFNFVTYYPSW
jgi:hypothetical protein